MRPRTWGRAYYLFICAAHGYTYKEKCMRNIGKVLGFGLLLTANIAFAAGGPEEMTPKDKASYAIGMDMARSLKRNGVEVNADVLGKAIKDVLVDNKVQLTMMKPR
jgi:hypothetical protein